MLSPRNAQIIAILLALSFLFGTPFQAARAQTKQKPEADQKTDYSQEAVVIEQLSTVYRYESDGTGQRELTMRIKIQSDAGVERFGQLVFPYTSANEKLEMDYVRVRKPDGSVVSATAADIQDLSAPLAREAPIYTDLRQKHITVPGLRPGDQLEYHLVWNIQTALAKNHFWVEHDFVERGPIVLSDELVVNIPATSKVKLKTEAGYDPTIKEDNGRRIYTWKEAQLKRAADEEEKEKEKAEAAEDEDVEEKDPDEIRPHVQLTTFQSWAEVGQWYEELQRDRVVPDDKIKVKAEEIIKGRATEKEKVTALYEYVAKNFRYVSLSLGQSRYQPHAATEVMSNQYGDCKDKHKADKAIKPAVETEHVKRLLVDNWKITEPTLGFSNEVFGLNKELRRVAKEKTKTTFGAILLDDSFVRVHLITPYPVPPDGMMVADGTMIVMIREQLTDLTDTSADEPGQSRVYTGSEVTRKVRLRAKPEPEAVQGVHGTVVLKAIFGSNGKVYNIVVVQSVPGLTERAINAARQIKFEPAIKDGHYVSMWMQLEYNFY